MRASQAGVAQSVEQHIRNVRVVGSNPITGSIKSRGCSNVAFFIFTGDTQEKRGAPSRCRLTANNPFELGLLHGLLHCCVALRRATAQRLKPQYSCMQFAPQTGILGFYIGHQLAAFAYRAQSPCSGPMSPVR